MTLKRKVANLGACFRGVDMWGRSVMKEFGDVVEFVGVCDINQGRVETAQKYLIRKVNTILLHFPK
jgi:hypothetical protein